MIPKEKECYNKKGMLFCKVENIEEDDKKMKKGSLIKSGTIIIDETKREALKKISLC